MMRPHLATQFARRLERGPQCSPSHVPCPASFQPCIAEVKGRTGLGAGDELPGHSDQG